MRSLRPTRAAGPRLIRSLHQVSLCPIVLCTGYPDSFAPLPAIPIDSRRCSGYSAVRLNGCSIAFVFRRADSVQDSKNPSIRLDELHELSIERRLRWVADAIDYFKHWYAVPAELAQLLKDSVRASAGSK